LNDLPCPSFLDFIQSAIPIVIPLSEYARCSLALIIVNYNENKVLKSIVLLFDELLKKTRIDNIIILMSN
jgi:hypothetical protein